MKHHNSNYTFSRVPSVVRPRSVFDRSRTYKTTFNEGLLIPFYLDEILPGDSCMLNVTAFARMPTLVVPFMDNLWMDFFFFFVPNRLIWQNWQRFCGEQDDPDDSTDYLLPTTTLTPTVGSLADYFGLPIGKEMTVTSLPFRAYELVWSQFFRDENLQDSSIYHSSMDDGPDDPDVFGLHYRGKRKVDPFTSALPWPQKGPGVEIAIGDKAPVVGTGKALALSDGTNAWVVGTSTGTTSTGSNLMTRTVSSLVDIGTDVTPASGSQVFAPNVAVGFPTSKSVSTLYADLTDATVVTINALREAFQVQKWYEQLARGGSRYQELLLSMFGTDAGDARLQRPEYLGGGSTPIQVHSVAQTSATADDGNTTPQGNLSAYAMAGTNKIGFSKSFVEHGYVLGLVCVRGDYTYQQGIDRMWSRQTKFDFYWPAFAHLGETPVLNKEIYYSGDSSIDDAAFGYQERWYDYRYGMSHITGKLRSGIVGSLDVWHLAQNFAQLPTLASTFIQERPPINRVVAVDNEPHFIFDSVIKCRMARVMPVYSVPGLVDHF